MVRVHAQRKKLCACHPLMLEIALLLNSEISGCHAHGSFPCVCIVIAESNVEFISTRIDDEYGD